MTRNKLRSKLGWVFAAGAAFWLVFDAGSALLQELQLGGETGIARATVIAKEEAYRPRRSWSRQLEVTIDRWIIHGHSKNFVTYRFELPDGREFMNEAPVGAALVNSVAEGSELEVRYAVSDPAVNQPTGESWLWLSLGRLAIGGLLALVLVGYGLTRLGRSRSQTGPIVYS
jgi:hypothetical protein